MISLWIICACMFATGVISSVPPPDYHPDTLPPPCVSPPYAIEVYNVTSSVKKRFACTRVYSELVNTGNVSEEVCFSIQLPAEAFLSGLCLEVGGRKYSGVVQEKELARETHEQNVMTGVTSGLIESRGMDQFRVCLSAGPGERALFSVEYQQLLVMRLGIVRYSVNIQPTQPVDSLYASIVIEDTADVDSVEVSGGEFDTIQDRIICTLPPPLPPAGPPTSECEEGVSVDFGASYRPLPVAEGVGKGSISGGYFVQFFSPTAGLVCLCQNFIFVIDKSGSMSSGGKMEQAKQAAEHLLSSLKDTDYFNIVAFDSSVNSFQPTSVSVGEYRERGLQFVKSLTAYGATNINSAVLTAVDQLCGVSSDCVSQITLLSDGQATSGVTDRLQIANNIRTGCTDTPISLNCLAFGFEADSALLQTLAYGNGGRYQFIWEGADASKQLVGFLETVLCPLLSNISFSFPGHVSNLSVTSFPAYYRGDELVVSGQVLSSQNVSFEVSAGGVGGTEFRYRGQIETLVSGEEEGLCLEAQLHAYQLIRQSLEQISAAETEEKKEKLTGKILQYALKFRFVTELTSLIVSPLLSEGCDCPSSCSCSPTPCLTERTSEVTDGIKINPETESETGDYEYDSGGPYGNGGPILVLYLLTTNTFPFSSAAPATTVDPLEARGSGPQDLGTCFNLLLLLYLYSILNLL